MTDADHARAEAARKDSATSTSPVVDSQIHMWFPDAGRNRWPKAGREYVEATTVLSSAEHEPMGPEALTQELDRVGVDQAILVPPVFAGDDNDAALAAAHSHPDRFFVMGRIALEDERAGTERLKTWLDDPAMVGVRLTFFWKQHRDLLDSGGTDWFWQRAEEEKIPVAVLPPGRLPEIARVARLHPELKIIVDHFGVDLNLKDEAAFEGLNELLPLASLGNVAVKASTLPSYVTDTYPFASLHDPIRRVVDAFGARRVFWGSEMTRLPCAYEDCLTLFTEALDFLSANDLEWIMGRGIREWLGIPGGINADY